MRWKSTWRWMTSRIDRIVNRTDTAVARDRRLIPMIDRLEHRVVQSVTAITAQAFPQLLAPPNDHVRFVTFTGTVTDNAPARPQASYQVVDLYHLYNPTGLIPLTEVSPEHYTFEFTLPFRASSSVNTQPRGRHFYVTIAAANQADANQFKVLPIFVPYPGFRLAIPKVPKHPLFPTPHHPTTPPVRRHAPAPTSAHHAR